MGMREEVEDEKGGGGRRDGRGERERNSVEETLVSPVDL